MDARHARAPAEMSIAAIRACGVRAADGVAPEHPGGVEVARVGELAGRPSGPRRAAGRPRRRGRARACVPACSAHGRPAAQPRRRRRSSRSRCSGRGCPRAPRGSRRRSGRALRASRSTVATTRPGVQKPHCTAPGLDERLLDAVQLAVRRRGPRRSSPRGRPPARRARGTRRRAAVEQHRAGAALALLAGVLRAREPEPLAQRVEQALAGPDVGLAPLAVDAERDLHAQAALQRARDEHAQRVAAVRGGAADVVDRARGRGDALREARRARRAARARARARARPSRTPPAARRARGRRRARASRRRSPSRSAARPS